MRSGWIEDVVGQPVHVLDLVVGRATWTPFSGKMAQGSVRVVLCHGGSRRFLGVTITRLGRVRMRGLFAARDIDVTACTDRHLELAIATGNQQAVSLLHVDAPESGRIASFIRG